MSSPPRVQQAGSWYEPDAQIERYYVEQGWWKSESIEQMVRRHARTQPDKPAFISPERTTSWQEYDALADEIVAVLQMLDLAPRERVAILLPDTIEIHATLVATVRAGLVAMGIGYRAGDAEIEHLIRHTGSEVVISLAQMRERPVRQLVDELRSRGVRIRAHVILSVEGVAECWDESGVDLLDAGLPRVDYDRMATTTLGPHEFSMLNSTSGTTGLPKCVTQFDSRWIHFSELAIAGADLTESDVFLGAVPAPFGFGLWTSHFAPTILGAPTAVMSKFSVDSMIDLIETHKVTVLCCVSTQFRMLLNSPRAATADLSSLRILFTGGEPIPFDRAAEFEDRFGATVLQFFGSNESGAFSYTTLSDPRERRLNSGGRLIPHMQVRLFDEHGNDVTSTGGPGIPGGKGPLTCLGYFGDESANAKLFTPDGWLLMGDLVTIDDEGFLTLVGRTSDIIIRGGKNISAPQVESDVELHPAVDLVAVVPVPDEIFGERVCAAVSLLPGASLTLEELRAFLDTRGMTREWQPEVLMIFDELPKSSGGKLAKGEVTRLVAARAAGGSMPS